ncbi:MAG: hypothetical protein ABJF23_03485 [Bryobacteraceae bacterium]
MKKIAMTLLAAAVAVPMFAAGAPQADPSAPATQMAKKHKKKSKKTTAALNAVPSAPAK